MCRNATFVSLHLPIYQFNYSLEIEFNAIVQLTSSTEFVSNSMGIIRLISIDVLFKLNYCWRFGCFNNIKSTCLPFYFDFKPTSWHFKCIYNFFYSAIFNYRLGISGLFDTHGFDSDPTNASFIWTIVEWLNYPFVGIWAEWEINYLFYSSCIFDFLFISLPRNNWNFHNDWLN